MWQRFKRMVRSVFGFFISMGEDPELILQQNIRDMEDQIPKINENIALIQANVKLLEKDNIDLDKDVKDLSAKIKAALTAGKRELALNYATSLEKVKLNQERNKEQLEITRNSLEKAKKIKQAFIAEKNRRSKEVLQVIQESKRAEWQEKVSRSMESFEIAGIDATHDEMIRKLKEKSALSEAKLEMALDNLGEGQLDTIDIEEEARKIQANEILRQFEVELGIAPEKTDDDIVKTIGSREEDKTKDSKQQNLPQKTMGEAKD